MVETKTQVKIGSTREDFLNLGNHYYQYAISMEDGYDIEGGEITQERIDGCWRLAAGNFWQAFVLGSEQAPLWLFKCFGQGVGVKQDDYIATLMYGIALKLNDPECKKIKSDLTPKIPESMNLAIAELATLIKETIIKIPSQEVSMEVVSQQMTLFDEKIKLPSEQHLLQFFTNSNSINIEETNVVGEDNSCCCVII